MPVNGTIHKQFEHKEGVAAYFSTQKDAWRKNYEANESGRTSLYRQDIIRRKETVLRLLDKHSWKDSMEILDIGCGAGILMKDMLGRGHKVTGSDISEEMIKEAERNTASFPSQNREVVWSDLENIAFPDSSFDFVTCVGVLEYQKNDDTAISEINRVLRPGGYAIITVPNLLRFKNIVDPYYYFKIIPRLVKKFRFTSRSTHSDLVKSFERNENLANRKFYYGQLNRVFRDHGLEIIDYVSISFSPLFTIWRKSILPMGTAFKVGDYLEKRSTSRHSLLKWFPNRWVICLRKTNN